jgi:hypothetical protein
MRIYLACALTHVPRDRFEAHCDLIHDLARELMKKGHTVKYALVDSDPQLAAKPFEDRARLCYLWDRRMVEESDLVVAEASYPSIGLGIEMQIAEDRGIPVLLMFSRDAKLKAEQVDYRNPDSSMHSLQLGQGYVSLMALGLPNVMRTIGYDETTSALQLVSEAVEEFDPHPKSP